MNPSLTTLFLLLAICFAHPAAAQPRNRYLGVTKFRGTLDFRLRQSGNEFGLQYDATASARASFTLERATSGQGTTPTWIGKMSESSTNISYKSSITTNGCRQSIDWTQSGPLAASEETYDVRLVLLANEWDFFLPRYLGPTTTVTVVTECPSGPPLRQNFSARLILPNDLNGNSYPGSGTSLQFNGPISDPSRFSPLSAQEYKWDCTVSIQPLDDELRLELSSSAYQNWRPSAKDDPEPYGEPIEITATVLRGSGAGAQPAPQDVERFEWELLNTSSEPGIAINFPPAAQDTDFDMKFDPKGDQLPADDKAQKMTRLVRNLAVDKAIILPSDWGAWSTLRVKAILRDGRELVGRFQGSNENDLRLPRRKPGSFVADVVKEQWNVDKSDSADDDPLDSSQTSGKGDGLTLYEEYRGFYADRKHSMGDPKRQHYFAVNDIGPDVDAGLAVFQRLTGLLVVQVNKFELSPKRVINSNHREAPHVVDQHGVIYRLARLEGGLAGLAEGGPGTPKDIEGIWIQSVLMPISVPAAVVSFPAWVVAHEAMHSVNVFHHGETDRTVQWASNNGVLQENGVSITVLDEAGNNLSGRIEAKLKKGPQNYELGVRGGQHSGDDNCVLRYSIAETYVDNTNPNVRRIFGGMEAWGAGLCSRKAGAGVNNKDRPPQSRYGDATVGDCKSQITVNDALSPNR